MVLGLPQDMLVYIVLGLLGFVVVLKVLKASIKALIYGSIIYLVISFLFTISM